LTQCTIRVPGFTASLAVGVGSQDSFAILLSSPIGSFSPYCNFAEIPSASPYLARVIERAAAP
jgi:hypothetical protein